MEPLREFVKTKAVWGTCAGAILLSQAVSNPKKGGQELLGGVSVTTMRNGWGSQVTSSLPPPARPFIGCNEDTILTSFFYTHAQVESFEAPLEVSGLRDANIPFKGIFIRAPVRFIFFSRGFSPLRRFCSLKVITELLQAPQESPIKIISRLPDSLLPHHTPDGGPTQTVVALRQGRHLLTTFHPELTGDNRFHEYFVQKCVVSSLAP
jgi:5'-phosphate synthase pdxT subunit